MPPLSPTSPWTLEFGGNKTTYFQARGPVGLKSPGKFPFSPLGSFWTFRRLPFWGSFVSVAFLMHLTFPRAGPVLPFLNLGGPSPKHFVLLVNRLAGRGHFLAPFDLVSVAFNPWQSSAPFFSCPGGPSYPIRPPTGNPTFEAVLAISPDKTLDRRVCSYMHPRFPFSWPSCMLNVPQNGMKSPTGSPSLCGATTNPVFVQPRTK